MMINIARSVRFPIQKGKKTEFTKMFNDELVPVLEAQPRFKNEIGMVNDDHVVGVSLWDRKDELNRYTSTVYPKLEATLLSLKTGKPKNGPSGVRSSFLAPGRRSARRLHPVRRVGDAVGCLADGEVADHRSRRHIDDRHA